MKGAIKTVGQKLLKVAAFAVMAVMVFVGGFTTSELLRKEEQQSAIKGTGNSLQAQQTINNGISLMAADGSGYVGNTLGQSVPYGALKVTATVSPATAKNQTLSWSCAWAGTTSSWSSGKTVEDYFSLSTSGANAHEVYLWAKQPFGDQITVTATSTDGGNKSATMTVDFAKRMNGLTSITGLAGVFDFGADIFYNKLSKAAYNAELPSFTANYGVGTKSLTWTCVDYEVSFSQDLFSDAQSALGVQANGTWYYSNGGSEVFAFNLWNDGEINFSNAENYNKLVTCISDNNGYLGVLTLYFESAETDSFGNKYTYEYEFDVEVSTEYLGMVVENVTLSDSTLTF